MEIEAKQLLVALFVVSLIVSYFVYSYFSALREKIDKARFLSERFTDNMVGYVSKKLSYLECSKPDFVWADENKICYKCGSYEACFGYTLVKRKGGYMVNPKGIPELKYKEFDIKAADFVTDGLASKLGCVFCKHFIILPNGKIKPISDFNIIARDICRALHEYHVACEGNTCYCGNYLVSYDENDKVVVYAQKVIGFY